MNRDVLEMRILEMDKIILNLSEKYRAMYAAIPEGAHSKELLDRSSDVISALFDLHTYSTKLNGEFYGTTEEKPVQE